MRILVVSTQFPFPPRSGFKMRVYQLTRRLAQRHDVTLLSYVDADPESPDDVEGLRRELRVEPIVRDWGSVAAKRVTQLASSVSRTPFICRLMYTAEMQGAIDRLCRETPFDVVQLESSPLCTFRVPADSRLLLDEHNIESEVFARINESERGPARRLYNRLEYVRFRAFERRWWGLVDGCAVTSEREERLIHEHAPSTPIAVVPNGVDLDYFRPPEESDDGRTVVFNGVLNYRPNLDAAHYLVDQIWPRVVERRADAQLAIVGRGDPADLRRLARPGITVTGEVPDIRPHLGGAAVLVVPIRMGGGTRLKVVEGLAMARPMVSTSLGCEGVRVEDGEQLLVADDDADFADAVVRLLEDRSLAHELGRAGRRRMEEEYSWDRAADRLDALLGDMMAAPARGATRVAASA